MHSRPATNALRRSSPTDNSNSDIGPSTTGDPSDPAPKAAAIRIEEGSGYSIVTSDDGSTFYAYFQGPDGSVTEAFYPNASMISSRKAAVVPAGLTGSASLISAAAWRDTSGKEHVSSGV